MPLHPDAEELWGRIRKPDCRDCRLHEEAKTVCLVGDGPIPCDVMRSRRRHRCSLATRRRSEPDDTCGVFALRGAVEFARQRGWAIRMLDLRTSGDIAGDPTRVVGYGAFAIAAG